MLRWTFVRRAKKKSSQWTFNVQDDEEAWVVRYHIFQHSRIETVWSLLLRVIVRYEVGGTQSNVHCAFIDSLWNDVPIHVCKHFDWRRHLLARALNLCRQLQCNHLGMWSQNYAAPRPLSSPCSTKCQPRRTAILGTQGYKLPYVFGCHYDYGIFSFHFIDRWSEQ